MSTSELSSAYQRGTHRDFGRVWGCLLKLLVVLAVSGIAAACGLFFWVRAHPEKLLERMIPTTPPAQMQVVANYTLDTSMGTFNNKSTQPVRFDYRAPNLFRVAAGSGQQQLNICSNGQQIYLALLAGQVVVTCPAPPNLAALAKDPALQKLSGKQLPAAKPGAKVNWREQITKVEFGIDPGSTWMKTVPTPPGSRAVTLTLKGDLVVTLWVNPRSGTLTQAALDLTAERLKSAQQQTKSRAGLPPGRPSTAGISMRHLVTFSKFDWRTPPDARRFQYRPPAGARVIRAKSLGELPTALMGAGGGSWR